MKKLIITTALFLGFSTMIFAQRRDEKGGNKTPEQRAEKITASLEKQLGLSQDQKTKIYAINLERAQKMESFKGDKQLKGQKGDVKTSFKNSDDQVLAVLTDSQRKTYQELKAKRFEQMKGKKGNAQGKGKRFGARPEKA